MTQVKDQAFNISLWIESRSDEIYWNRLWHSRVHELLYAWWHIFTYACHAPHVVGIIKPIMIWFWSSLSHSHQPSIFCLNIKWIVVPSKKITNFPHFLWQPWDWSGPCILKIPSKQYVPYQVYHFLCSRLVFLQVSRYANPYRVDRTIIYTNHAWCMPVTRMQSRIYSQYSQCNLFIFILYEKTYFSARTKPFNRVSQRCRGGWGGGGSTPPPPPHVFEQQ